MFYVFECLPDSALNSADPRVGMPDGCQHSRQRFPPYMPVKISNAVSNRVKISYAVSNVSDFEKVLSKPRRRIMHTKLNLFKIANVAEKVPIFQEIEPFSTGHAYESSK